MDRIYIIGLNFHPAKTNPQSFLLQPRTQSASPELGVGERIPHSVVVLDLSRSLQVVGLKYRQEWSRRDGITRPYATRPVSGQATLLVQLSQLHLTKLYGVAL